MAKGRKTKTTSTALSPQVIAAVFVAVVAIGAIVYFSADDDQENLGGGSTTYTPVSGFADIHGMALNPEDPNELYIATHHGLIRGVDDGNWSLVGDLRADFMGFTMHPSDGDTFWASGHPARGGNMGVIKSADGGFTWEQIALDGVDFHAMTISPANPDVLWGYSQGYRGQLYRTQDGGDTWDIINENPPRLRSLTADPQDEEVLYASTGEAISRSTDGGQTWSSFASIPANALAISPDAPSTMYAGTTIGVAKSTDGGQTWTSTPLRTNAPVGYLAVNPQDPSAVYAATYATAIHKTTDGGDQWEMVKEPVNRQG